MANLSIEGRGGFRLERISVGLCRIKLLRFRHKIFREQLRWMAASEDGLDLDEYDAFSDNYAVLMDEEVIGSVRITPGTHRFMVEREFARFLPPGSSVRKGKETAEITRFAVGLGEDGLRPEPVSRLLYLALYAWASFYQVRWMYFVVEAPFFHHLQRLGFPVFPVGKTLSLHRSATVVAFLDWEVATPGFIRWLQAAVESPAVNLVQSHEFGYSR